MGEALKLVNAERPIHRP